MSRLIDADAFDVISTKAPDGVDADSYIAGIAYVVSKIDAQPTIEERKTGKWISLDDFRGRYNDYGYKCSECGEHSDYEENFCPNCGTDMRGNDNGSNDTDT